jgi:hypothetical protein
MSSALWRRGTESWVGLGLKKPPLSFPLSELVPAFDPTRSLGADFSVVVRNVDRTVPTLHPRMGDRLPRQRSDDLSRPPIARSQFADAPSLTAVFSVNIQREMSLAGLKFPSLARVNPKIQFLACEIHLLLFTSLTSLGKRSRRTSSILCF